MSHHVFITPSTPPRKPQSRGQTSLEAANAQEPFTPGKHKAQLSTPAKSVKWTQITPVTEKKPFLSVLEAEASEQLPISPEKTPHPSTRKRKVLSDDIFTCTQEAPESSPTKSDYFGLLLPAPSTIGSGRKINAGHRMLIPRALNFDLGVRHQQPNDDSEMYHEIEEESEQNDASTLKILGTPAKQLVDEKQVEIWYGKSFNNYSSDEEEDSSELRPDASIVNPFKQSSSVSKANVSQRSSSSNPFKSDGDKSQKHAVNLKTHIEYMNHITGEKIKVPMSPEQMKIKPKKLDFSQFNKI